MQKKLSCILLIDDDEPTNFINRMIIEEVGCAGEVKIMQGGREALDYLSHCGESAGGYPCPDLILLDVNMPAMDGWEFLAQYKELSNTQKAEIVVVMLTTSLNPDDQIRAERIPEISGFRNKPLNADMLRQIITDFFGVC
ncbi:MAG: response regulator [Puia sp.]|nr:response regulator [Puia sp.]